MRQQTLYQVSWDAPKEQGTTQLLGDKGRALQDEDKGHHGLVFRADDRMVLVLEEQLAAFLQRLQMSSALQKRVKGVLVLPGSPASLTYADRFPLAQYAPYAASDYAWNRNGTHVSMLGIGTLPIFLLEGDAAAQAQQHAQENALKVCYYTEPPMTMTSHDHKARQWGPLI